MYLQHFGLADFPFKITPDPEFLYWTRDHRRAYDALSLGVFQREPITVLTGDIGVGKTTLLRRFISAATPNQTVGLISNFSSGDGSLWPWVASAFDLPTTDTEIKLFETFKQFVGDEFAAGRRVILILDEAQNASDEDLEQLRMLSNINDGNDVPLLLFLIGQPEFRSRLKEPQNRKLSQRVGITFHIGVMTPASTADYIKHRLQIVGAQRPIFDEDALGMIADYSGGIPRMTNVVCEMLLFAAFRKGVQAIDGEFARMHLEEAKQSGVLSHFGEAELPVSIAKVSGHNRRGQVKDVSISGPKVVQDDSKAETKPTPLVLFPTKNAGRDPDALNLATEATLAIQRTRPARGRFGVKLGAIGAVAAVAVGLVVADVFDGASTGPRTSSTPLRVSSVPMTATEPPAPSILPNASGQSLIDDALAPNDLTPQSEAIAFARAALRGEAMAAYFLGQMFEAGDGLPSSPALARIWYQRAAPESRGARHRLANLEKQSTDGSLVKPPVPLLGGMRADGSAEFVWAAGEGSGPAQFLIETAKAPDQTIEQFGPFDLSAAVVATKGEPRVWRVLAVSPDAKAAPTMSDWYELDATPVSLR